MGWLLPSVALTSASPDVSSQGPLAVFSSKQRWTAPRTVRVRPEDRDVGFTLRGDAPVQVVSLDPLCPAAVSQPGAGGQGCGEAAWVRRSIESSLRGLGGAFICSWPNLFAHSFKPRPFPETSASLGLRRLAGAAAAKPGGVYALQSF